MEIDKQTLELLNEMGFTPGKDEKLFELKIEGGFAYVDFRKTDGRRYAMIDRKPVLETDLEFKAPVLIEFKKKRDEIHVQEQQGKGSPPTIPPVSSSSGGTILNQQIPTTPTITSPAPDNPNLYEFFFELVGVGGIVEIFGGTGSLKSQICTETCKDARKLNKTFFYLDTEGKVGLANKKALGDAYKYLPVWEGIVKTITGGLPKYDLYIVDSIGFPISTEYADMKANEQGSALQDMMAVVGKYLKAWAYNNNAIVIFTNQPKSDFMKSEQELLRPNPFGDKVHFAANIILKTEKTIVPGHLDAKTNKVIPLSSIATLYSHRSTDFADDVIMLTMYKNNDEIKVEIPKHVTKRLKELKG